MNFKKWVDARFKNVNQSLPSFTLSYVTLSKLYKGHPISIESAKVVEQGTLGEVPLSEIPIGKSRGAQGKRRICEE